ncbi:DJ-1/PfpI family protein [Merismopedia glauca]|uniref:DJ-1/PfpI family protein n=1 Tax=Merismopedia glauca TaxID=292586 RepID=UPI0030DDDB3A
MSKVLIVTTSHDHFEGANPHPTGVWLEEFAVPYMELLHNGVEITVASPKGGSMPIDPRSLPTPEQDKAWQRAIAASKQTTQLSKVSATEFDAIFLPGGHGPMFDLPDNSDLQQLLREFHDTGKIIAAVCHGPVGLVGATLSDGTPLVKDKVLTSYTNSEEIAVKLDKEVPFSLEERLRDLGAIFIAHEDKADHVEKDGKLITGQNPNSSASIARALVAALNQQLPAIFERTLEAIAPAQIVAEFPVNTFLENLAIAPDGTIFITSYEDGKVYRMTQTGELTDFAKVEGNMAGIVIEPTGDLLVAATLKGKEPTICRIQPTGSVERILTLPEAIFLNGMTHLQGNLYLVADSYKGAIWAVDAISQTARIWLEDPLLARSDASNPFPAVNGIKIYQNALFASNTQRQLLIRIPLTDDGAPGKPEVFLTNVNLDDFAFDNLGNLYGTTHVYNSVIRISPTKEITTIAKAEQGMTGNTAVAFGRTSNDNTSIYITTNGGMSLPPSTGVELAKVVRLEVGVQGE